MHKGNANIIYRTMSSGAPLAGQIQQIENVGITVRLHVRRHLPLSTSLYDPFLRYPHLQAKTYSSTLSHAEDIIDLDDIIAHAAHYDYSHNRSVMLNLSRQSNTLCTSLASCFCILILTQQRLNTSLNSQSFNHLIMHADSLKQ